VYRQESEITRGINTFLGCETGMLSEDTSIIAAGTQSTVLGKGAACR
jgi:hypothetical protein